jgi:hypothetical protein
MFEAVGEGPVYEEPLGCRCRQVEEKCSNSVGVGETGRPSHQIVLRVLMCMHTRRVSALRSQSCTTSTADDVHSYEEPIELGTQKRAAASR